MHITDTGEPVSGDGAAGPLPRVTAGIAPGIVLASLSCLPVAGILLITQVLPQMEAAYQDVPQIRLLVSLALTAPALAIGLTSYPSGWLSDRLGGRRLLLGALLLYALFGMAPLVVTELGAIIATRFVMGVMEGIVITCSTALISDLYGGRRRARLLSLQTSVASGAAVAFAVLGGVLGQWGWRMPFAVYAIALLFVPLVAAAVPADTPAVRPASSRPAVSRPVAAPMPWRALLPILAATVIIAVCFYVVQIQLPFLLNGLGVIEPGLIGLASAVANAAVIAGTVVFALLARFPVQRLAALCLALLTSGLVVIAASAAPVPLMAGVVLASFGGGIALPTLLVATMARLPPRSRGGGAGLWQTSFWGGQFVSPVLVVPVTAAAGSLSAAVGAFAGLAVLAMAAVLLFGLGRDQAAPEI